MGHKYAKIAFTDTVRAVQEEHGNHDGLTMMEAGGDYAYLLGEQEANFIKARDSFYMASVSETGWPYVQHRGGPVGFMQIIDNKTIGFADFSGNRQYISTGNFKTDNRVSLFFMNYPNKTRFKLLGRVQLVTYDDPELLARLEVDDYRARVERGFIIHIEAFDWNCPQHITRRYTESYIDNLMAGLIEDNKLLKANQFSLGKGTNKVLGDGPLSLVITGIRQLTQRVRAYELRDPAGADLPIIEAGSHLQVPVQLDSGEMTLRNYSICSNPARRDIYEIAVLHHQEGLGGSHAIHEHYYLGLELRCELSKNYFQLHSDHRPAVLIAAGIGITPIKSMAQALQKRNTPLNLYYAGRSRGEMAFVDRLEREFGNKITLYSADDGDRMDIKHLLSSASDDSIFYVCGPESLIDAVTQTAQVLNILSERVRFERFSHNSDQDAKAIQIKLHRSGKQLQVAADQTILDAMLEAGIDAPHNCRSGSCKSCAVKVLGGDPDHRDSVLIIR